MLQKPNHIITFQKTFILHLFTSTRY